MKLGSWKMGEGNGVKGQISCLIKLIPIKSVFYVMSPVDKDVG